MSAFSDFYEQLLCFVLFLTGLSLMKEFKSWRMRKVWLLRGISLW
jgi:hypothetical protein